MLVRFKQGVSEANGQAVIQSVGGRGIGRLARIGVEQFQLPANANERAIEAILQNRAEVDFVEVDQELPLDAVTPNDPLYSSQWHLPRISAPAAWSVTTGNPSVIVAILDTGVDATHEDLSPNMVAGWNVWDNNSDTSDVYGHGTKVAGTVAAIGNNAKGVASVAWSTRIMPVRVSMPTGSAYFSVIASGLTWAADHGARVANISYAATNSSTVTAAAEYFQSLGGVVTVSAGNQSTFDSSPDNPYILTVSATDPDDNLYSWSNTGNNVDVAAPGCVYVPLNGGGYGSGCGTSYSAPITAGVAALVFAMNPGATAAEVQSIIQQSADDFGDPGFDPVYGWGRVNAANAVGASGGGGDTQAPSVAITSPAGGSTVSGIVNVQVSASDDTGVASVEIRIDGAQLCIDGGAPYTCSWTTTTASNGSHTISAKATDAAGNSSTASVTVTVNNADTQPPTVSITSPANGSTVSGTVGVLATASDDIGVASVSISVDGVPLCTDVTAPYACNWDTTTASGGSHTLRAVAADAAGNTATATISVNVNVVDTQAPLVGFLMPSAGSTVGGTYTVQVSATDNVGVTSVQVSVDGAALCTDASSPYTCSWDTTGLTNGSHSLTAVASDAAGNTANKSITVNVSNAATEGPTVAFASPTGGATVGGAFALEVSASDQSGISSVFVRADSSLVCVFFVGSGPYKCSWDTTFFSDGNHTLTATATSGTGETNADSVLVNVSNNGGGGDTQAPSVSISSPANGSTVNGTVDVQALASDNVGVTSVAIRVDGNPLCTVSSGPYSCPWNTAAAGNGNHSLTAIASDAAGNTNNHSITVSVNNPDTQPPSVSITSPASGANVSGPVTIAASASDNVGVASVQFLVDGSLVCTDISSPYNCSWNTTSVSNGSHTLTAKAFDTAGNSQTASVSVNVSNADTQPPTVSITSPASGANVNGTVTIQATASDNVGVKSVQFLVDGSLVCTVSSSPYNCPWNTTSVSNSSHTLTAKAFDAAGNSQTASVSVNVNNPDTQAPTVSITSPANNATLSGSAAFGATASDNISVTSVVFSVDNVTVYTDFTSPYYYPLDTTTLSNGNHTLAARAMDAAGNSKTATITVIVDNVENTPPPGDSEPPVVTITSPTEGSSVSKWVTLQADADDNVAVVRVEFYVDGKFEGSDTSAPFDTRWKSHSASKGDHVLQAKAYDEAGNIGTSPLVTVNVK